MVNSLYLRLEINSDPARTQSHMPGKNEKKIIIVGQSATKIRGVKVGG